MGLALLALGALIAGGLFYVRSGLTLAELWTSISGVWRSFLGWSLGLILLGGLVVGLVYRQAPGRSSLRLRRAAQQTRLRRSRHFAIIAGLLLMGLGGLWAGYGFLGQGWGWSLVLIGGVLWLFLGCTLACGNECWVLESTAIAKREALFGRERLVERVRWRESEAPQIKLEVHANGGAFGQPYIERFEVLVNQVLLLSTPDRQLATTMEALLRQHYEQPA